jgi:hypothetical protein
MVIEAVAVGAVAILKQYLSKSGEGFAKKVGEKLADKVGQLYHSVKSKFENDPDAKKTLAWTEEDPNSTARLSALEGVLSEKLRSDPNFAMELDRLVQEVKAADTQKMLVVGERNITVGRDANGVFITGDHSGVVKR